MITVIGPTKENATVTWLQDGTVFANVFGTFQLISKGPGGAYIRSYARKQRTVTTADKVVTFDAPAESLWVSRETPVDNVISIPMIELCAIPDRTLDDEI